METKLLLPKAALDQPKILQRGRLWLLFWECLDLSVILDDTGTFEVCRGHLSREATNNVVSASMKALARERSPLSRLNAMFGGIRRTDKKCQHLDTCDNR